MNSRSVICKFGPGLPPRPDITCHNSPGYLKSCFGVFSDTFKIHFRRIVVSWLVVHCRKVFFLLSCSPFSAMFTTIAVTTCKQRWYTYECKGEVIRPEIHTGF